MYSHHFALLAIGLFFPVTLFLLGKSAVKNLILLALALTLGYLPHIQITLHQLSLGGLGWLGKPDVWFVFDYFRYQVHFQDGLLVLVIFLSAVGFFNRKREINGKQLFALAFLALMPLLIGYLYSVYRGPVLQFSVLIFTAPFLLLVLGFGFSGLSPKVFRSSMLAILVFSVLSLFFERHHYQISKEQPFNTIPEWSVEISKGKPLPVFLTGRGDLFKHYANPDFEFTPVDYNLDGDEYAKVLLSAKADTLIIGNPSPKQKSIALSLFPKVLATKAGFTFDALFITRDDALRSAFKPIDSLEFITSRNLSINSSLDSLYKNRIIQHSYKASSANGALLVVEVLEGDQRVHYSTTKYILADSVYTATHVLNLKMAFGRKSIPSNVQVKAYLWNRNKLPLQSSSFSIREEYSNPHLYGFYHEF